jgi:hypothetical protein
MASPETPRKLSTDPAGAGRAAGLTAAEVSSVSSLAADAVEPA